MLKQLTIVAITLVLLAPLAHGAESRPEHLPPAPEGATLETYRTVNDTDLMTYIFQPDTEIHKGSRPAIVFFFGGGWRKGTPKQFFPHCEYLASRGMVALGMDYRVSSRQDVKVLDCIQDALAAMRWTRDNAQRLGIDPDRIVSAGGSAGGHLAACTAVYGEVGENETSPRPNALALFNPGLALAPYEGVDFDEEFMARLTRHLGTTPETVSPIHLLKSALPPTIIFHGAADDVVPLSSIEAFAKAAPEGSNVTIEAYPGEDHGFFNYTREDKTMFRKTLTRLDVFLRELGYIDGTARVDTFFKKPE
jgi:acetyl esterase/lipase